MTVCPIPAYGDSPSRFQGSEELGGLRLLAMDARSTIPAPDIEPARTSASPEAVARSVEEIATELLMITEVKVGLRKRGLISVREGIPGAQEGLPVTGQRGFHSRQGSILGG